MSLLKKTPLFCASECATFLDLLRPTYSKESQIAASLYFRKKLAACQEPPSELVENLICELIECLRRPISELQLNASWALTNLACGSRQETHRIVASGGVEALMHLASTTPGEVQDQAIWALGNLAADCAVCREQVRAAGLLNLLMTLLELPDYQAHDPRKIMIWCLANLLRGGINDLDLESVSRLFSSLHTTITLFDAGEILCDSVWCIAHLIDHANVEGERIDILFQQPGLANSVVALLKSESIRALTGALRTVGNIITGTDEQTTAILDMGVLDDLNILVNSRVHQISRECLWILSNIAAGTTEHVTRLFTVQKLAESVFRLCMDNNPRKRKEAYWVLVNAMMGAPLPIYDYLLGGGLAQILVQLIHENLDPILLDRTMNTIRHSLQDRPQYKEYTLAVFRRVGLVEQILKIARNPIEANNQQTVELAHSILQQHFNIHVMRNQDNTTSTTAATSSAANGTEEDDMVHIGAADFNRGNREARKKNNILVRIKRVEDF